jgi:hypothetical protein
MLPVRIKRRRRGRKGGKRRKRRREGGGWRGPKGRLGSGGWR